MGSLSPLGAPTASRWGLSSWTVGRRLTVTAVLCGAAVVALLAAGWSGLSSSARASAQLEKHFQAQSRHQDLDMAHDAIYGTVAAGTIAGLRGDGAGVARAVEDLADERRSVREVFLAQAAAELPPARHRQLDEAAARMDVYLDQGAGVLDGVGAAFPAAAWESFVQTRDELEVRLGEITDAFRADAASAQKTNEVARRQALLLMAATAAVALVIAVVSTSLIRRSITRSLARVGEVAGAVAAGDLSIRNRQLGNDEIGQLGAKFNQVADSLETMVGRLRQDAERSAFGKELAAALEMVDTEREVYDAVQRAMTTAAGASKVELLLADSSQAHLEQATVHPENGGPGCGVQSPFACPAVRRGATVLFRTSDALDACPKLVDRDGGPYAAVCAPVSFMGRALGVLHSTRPVDQPFSGEQIDRIGTLATGVGTRIGTVRAFQKTQLQASTDALTGLMNRRTMEEHIGGLVERGERFAMAVADLDHFKRLNDTYGHETGDRALRQFAEVMRSATRDEDLICRWGGEEFTIVFPGVTAATAGSACDRIREALLLAAVEANMPTFTASFGISDSSMGSELAELFRVADEALYAAKDQGRNRCVVGQDTSRSTRHVVEHPAVMQGLRAADG